MDTQSSTTTATVLTWLARSGYLLIALGVMLLSPLGDLLPVELWDVLHGRINVHRHYFRLVPGETGWVMEATLIAVGLVLVVVARAFRRRLEV